MLVIVEHGAGAKAYGVAGSGAECGVLVISAARTHHVAVTMCNFSKGMEG